MSSESTITSGGFYAHWRTWLNLCGDYIDGPSLYNVRGFVVEELRRNRGELAQFERSRAHDIVAEWTELVAAGETLLADVEAAIERMLKR